MTRILDVPYRSQWDDDAYKSNTDCGPACLAMVLGYYGKPASSDKLSLATGAQPGKYVSFGQLQRAARDYDITFEYGADSTLNDLKRWIDEGKPAIVLIKYSYWSQIEPRRSTQDTFTGPHFVVVVGYGNGNIYVNDPNYWPPRREEGHKKAWSEVLFNLAWSNVRTSRTPNPNSSAIVPKVGKVVDGDFVSDTDVAGTVIEYTVRQGDTWTGLAARFYGDKHRYPELLAFNNLSAGTPPYVGQKLRFPVTEAGDGAAPPDQPVILGEGAVQTVNTSLVKDLKEKWVSEGRLTPTAGEATILRVFVDEIKRWDSSKAVVNDKTVKLVTPVWRPNAPDQDQAAVIEYIVQPGDTWPGIAGKFLGDQTRFPEILEINQLHPDTPLWTGQTLRIPPK